MDILEHTIEKGIYASFTTNGMLIDKVVNNLSRLRAGLLPIQISIHGSSAQIAGKYDIQSKEWQQTIANCRLLNDAGIRFGIKMVVSRLNYANLLESVEVFSELGAENITFLHLLPIGKGQSIAEMSQFSKEEVAEIIRQIRVAKSTVPNIHLDYRPFLNIYFPREPRTKLDELVDCPAGRLDLRIRYDGRVLQCSSVRVPLDDVRNRGLREIWGTIEERMVPCPYECNSMFNCIQI